MLRNILILALAAGLGLGAAKAPAPAAKARRTAPAALDPRDPSSLISLLAGLSAKATVARRDGDAVYLAVTSPTEVFSAQFGGCDAQGRNCQAVLFDRQGEAGAPTLAQLNAFNQTSLIWVSSSARLHRRLQRLPEGPGGVPGRRGVGERRAPSTQRPLAPFIGRGSG